MVSISFLIVLDVGLILIYLFLGHFNVRFGGWLHTLHYTNSYGWPRCRTGQVGVHHFARKLLSRTEEGLPGADVKRQEASKYSVMTDLLLLLLLLLLSPGII